MTTERRTVDGLLVAAHLRVADLRRDGIEQHVAIALHHAFGSAVLHDEPLADTGLVAPVLVDRTVVVIWTGERTADAGPALRIFACCPLVEDLVLVTTGGGWPPARGWRTSPSTSSASMNQRREPVLVLTRRAVGLFLEALT